MAVSTRLELNLADPDGPEPDFGDIKQWVELATKYGVQPSDPVFMERNERDEVIGLYVYMSAEALTAE